MDIPMHGCTDVKHVFVIIDGIGFHISHTITQWQNFHT